MRIRFAWESAAFCLAVNALFGAWFHRFLDAVPFGNAVVFGEPRA